MSNPAQGAVGAETMTLSDQIADAIERRWGDLVGPALDGGSIGWKRREFCREFAVTVLERFPALASPRADSDERTAGEVEPGRAAFARWSSLQPEFQDRIWASMSDDVRAFWVRQENDQAAVAAAGVTPWKTGQSGYAREAVVIEADDQVVEIGVTHQDRIDLIVHNRAGEGIDAFDDLTARMTKEEAALVVSALVEAGASKPPGVLWSSWPEDDCDGDPMEFGQDAYDITNETRGEAIAALNALGEHRIVPAHPTEQEAEPYRSVAERCEILAAELADEGQPARAALLWEADAHIRALEAEPAPDSPLTGPVGMEELREEVAYWRRDLSARLWSMTALYKAALERGEGDHAADIANALRSALASYHDAEAGEWHDRCELCGEFVRDGEARAAWEDVSGHARCLSEDEKGHVDPYGDEDLARRAEEAQAALDAPWPEAALAARPAAQGAERVRHVKRGTEYEVLGEAEAQISKQDRTTARLCGDHARVLHEEDRLVVYRSVADGKLWCRFPDEFRDGRFEPAPPSSGQGGR